MILDANTMDRGLFARPFDVCVVGSGPAGVTLARRLAGHGLEVALMEAGGLEIAAESQELYVGELVGRDYHPTDAARLRYFGGTSNHWEGRCRPLDPHDFTPWPHHRLSGWPIGRAELDPYAAEADEILDLAPIDTVPDRPVEAAEADSAAIRFRFSPPTRFNAKYRAEIAGSDRIRLVLNANLVDVRLNDARTLATEAVFRSYRPEDPGFRVQARGVALCLGGMENPRALLNMTGQVPAGIGNAHDLVGRFFQEHPAFRVGEVLFQGDVPPTRGYAPTPGLMARTEALNFNLLLFTRAKRFVDEALRSIACSGDFMERLAERVLGRPVSCGTGGLGRYFAARRSEDFATGLIGLIIEQELDPASRVRLGEERDRFGLRRLALDWRMSALDFHTMRTAVAEIGRYLARQRIGRVKVADWLLEEPPVTPPVGSKGSEVALFHHLCTTRMSADPRSGVVDRDCRVHGIENLYIGGSSVFATGGHANPTYTIVQLALRLGDHLAAVPA